MWVQLHVDWVICNVWEVYTSWWLLTKQSNDLQEFNLHCFDLENGIIYFSECIHSRSREDLNRLNEKSIGNSISIEEWDALEAACWRIQKIEILRRKTSINSCGLCKLHVTSTHFALDFVITHMTMTTHESNCISINSRICYLALQLAHLSPAIHYYHHDYEQRQLSVMWFCTMTKFNIKQIPSESHEQQNKMNIICLLQTSSRRRLRSNWAKSRIPYIYIYFHFPSTYSSNARWISSNLHTHKAKSNWQNSIKMRIESYSLYVPSSTIYILHIMRWEWYYCLVLFFIVRRINLSNPLQWHHIYIYSMHGVCVYVRSHNYTLILLHTCEMWDVCFCARMNC